MKKALFYVFWVVSYLKKTPFYSGGDSCSEMFCLGFFKPISQAV